MNFLYRFGAAGGVLAGLAIGIPGAIESFAGKTVPTSFVLGLSPFVALPLLLALFLRQSHAAGRLGPIGFAINLVGLGMFGAAAYTLDIALIHLNRSTVTDLLRGPVGAALIASVLVFVAGSVLFGLSMVNARVYPRLTSWGYTIVLPIFALAAPLPYSPYKGVLHLLAAAILIRLSARLNALTQPLDASSDIPLVPASLPTTG